MLQFVWNKIKNKKWLNLCLLVGITLLIALFVCHPMFEKGASNQVLETGFEDYAREKTEFPAIIGRTGSYDAADYPTAQSVYDRLQSYEDKWTDYVQIDTVASQKYLNLSGGKVATSLGGRNYYFGIGLLSDMDDHIDIVKGEGLQTAASKSGVFPCIISESTMDSYGLVVGEILNFSFVTSNGNQSAVFEIVGICREADSRDNYWHHDLEYFGKQVFVSQDTFDTMISDYGQDKIAYEDNLLLDYTQINTDSAAQYADYIRQFHEADSFFTDNMLDTLDTFATEKQTIRMMLWALEVPCIVLLLLFIYMVSSQILTSEEGEIAVLRSRGVTRFQTIMLYLLQSFLLSMAGMCAGLFLGYGMCKFAASTDAFLKFAGKDVSLYRFSWEMFPYGFAACLIAVLFMTIPVWKRSKATIVSQKSADRYSVRIPVWERCFLDVILMAVSCYLLFNFNKQQDTLAMSVIAQEGIDPVMLLDTSLFIFACGLLFLRLCRYLILFINRIGRKRWSPAMYASFLQLVRTYHKQGFLAVFLIMTIASGIFDANMARTMNHNMEERIYYNVGSDIQMKSPWKLMMAKGSDEKYRWEYTEPDYGAYSGLVESGVCESMTRVIEDDNAEVTANSKIVTQVQLMGIQTKEFGETAQMMDGLNDVHWFYALNALAEESEGVIISRNLADTLDVKEGDMITYSRYHPIAARANEKMGSVSGKVSAIVDSFPGYERYIYDKDEEGNVAERENYLIVGNYATIISEYQMTPYTVWMRLASGAKDEDVSAYLEDAGIESVEWQSVQEQITDSRNSAMVQVTNGMFTLSFIISLMVCSAGFLIYWIMSIKSRELLFGIYRAMGMRMREINRMLINEQIFSSLLAILAGGGAGALATALFVRLIALIYLPEKHNISIQIYIYASDLIKLAAVILAVVLLCYMVLRLLLRNMKIAQALRLGED